MKPQNKIYWAGRLLGILDDFGDVLRDEFIDGTTTQGPAVMTLKSWRRYGIRHEGFARYCRQPDGRWLKDEENTRIRGLTRQPANRQTPTKY